MADIGARQLQAPDPRSQVVISQCEDAAMREPPLVDCTQCEDDLIPHQDVPVLVQPRLHRAKISVWTHVSATDMDCLAKLEATNELWQELVRIFYLDDHDENPRSAVLLDLFFYAIQFAKESCFNKAQTAALLSMLRQTHDVATETPFDNMSQCYCFFHELVLCHSVQRPPFSIALFTACDAKRVIDYVVNSYFRHFKLYKYVFTPSVSLDLSFCYHGVPETPEPSEAGRESGMAAGERGDEEEEEKVDECPIPEQESEAVTALRRLVREHLAADLERLKADVDAQIEQATCCLTVRLMTAECEAEAAGGPAPPPDATGLRPVSSKKQKVSKGKKQKQEN